MEVLWAPWRIEYLTGPREEGCIFCKKPADRDRLRENLILHLGELSFVIMNRYPYQSAHLMVIPYRHTDDFAGLTPEEHADMGRLLQACTIALREAYRPEGFNIGMNLGQSAGAGIREHLHYHIIPRWVGDTNFFPMLSGTKSMPEMLDEVYAKLRPGFRSLERRGLLGAGGHRDAEGAP
jgi:ATP adenylyltransferase